MCTLTFQDKLSSVFVAFVFELPSLLFLPLTPVFH